MHLHLHPQTVGESLALDVEVELKVSSSRRSVTSCWSLVSSVVLRRSARRAIIRRAARTSSSMSEEMACRC